MVNGQPFDIRIIIINQPGNTGVQEQQCQKHIGIGAV